tara:strand:- start:1110 stop:1688 length:579 start_codon:yes stop_codon:yes gene_type:complete
MVDFNKLNEKLQNVEAKRVDRDYVAEGRHVVKIVGAETRETQAGKEIAIIEADILSSNTHEEGAGVKQIFALSNEPQWRIDQNLALIRAMINAACPGVSIDGAFLGSCLSGGKESALADTTLMIIAKSKISKNEKKYLDFSYKIAEADTKVGGQRAIAAAATAPVVVAGAPAPVEAEDDIPFGEGDVIPFDI